MWGNQMPGTVCNLPQQTEVKSAELKMRWLNPDHLLQSWVVWDECPAVYADTKLTARMTSLTTIRHWRLDSVIRVLVDATRVHGHVSTAVRFVQNPNLL